ncbi:glycogen debranching protein [Arthrobacter sp. AFG7.2]|uniref:glucosylglycerate hydrolase n=1 Tax=Arthrobacter sp. AFG7.2 TaxID=1688693 RepID=UPI000C9EBCF0|nr:glycogen debranching protein [Arthrobacter sp. AFG7.2]PNI09236.1 glycogen debranching protein [Arthrobacter sp. AFG7.2]
MSQAPDGDSYPIQDLEELGSRARDVLAANDLGTMVTAAPNLYPHMWSWDAAFVATGLSTISIERALQELDYLLAAQWKSGMIPHIVFSDVPGYFPDVDRWGTRGASPEGVQSSGICQPPVHTTMLRRIVERATTAGGEDARLADEFVRRTLPRWIDWHAWLRNSRAEDGSGLLTIYHGWESGMDNSPRFDGPYSRVQPGEMEPFVRTDTLKITDHSQRPSDEEYSRYLWLVQQMADVGFDDERLPGVMDFQVKDVFMSAIFATANEDLAVLAEQFGRPQEAPRLRQWAQEFCEGVDATVDERTGLARDRDVLTGEWIGPPTMAGFAPLISTTDQALLERQLEVFEGPEWTGDPRLAFPLPASTSTTYEGLKPRQYWRGPVWPVMNWYLAHCLRRRGDGKRYHQLREASLAQLMEGHFGEYYEPFTGEPLGSMDQSWTAAVALEWLADPENG